MSFIGFCLERFGEYMFYAYNPCHLQDDAQIRVQKKANRGNLAISIYLIKYSICMYAAK